ncbi:helix-turn-helix domain-containing protein [Sphingomonas sp. PAMC 26617]|uniref:helix-turn-helix domain-containing protein n=1 Tax=Sphingomonas sp. PAMC 26617 TaxID=1112216 RepID=UPI0002899D3B|nr:AraC family transcriptional regulator [Sphingomonas sp. PAMC 26617]
MMAIMNTTAIDQILAALAVNVKEFAVCAFTTTSAIAIEPLDKIEVHFVLAGTLYLGLEDGTFITAPTGSMVLVPAHVSQVIGGSASPSDVFSPEETCSKRRDGLVQYDATTGSASSVLVACGQIKADIGGSFGPFEGLKAPIHSHIADEPVVGVAFSTILRETGVASLGSKALIGALMKACLILALRRSVQELGARNVLPGLFERPSLARAVALVVEDPASSHSLTDLARAAGMSRSKFAKVFAETLGSPPMAFVTHARLDKARNLLLSTELSIADIAHHVGFASRSHFSRSFRTAFGIDPTRMRQSGEARDAS